MNDRTLHVFANKVIDWVVAADAADASVVWTEHTGDAYDEQYSGPWSKLDDTKLLVVNDEEDGHITREAAEWAARNGRGFLASTEY